MSRQSVGSAHSKTTQFTLPTSDMVPHGTVTVDQCYIPQRRPIKIDRFDSPHVPQDWRDQSVHPSYTNCKVPYHLICRLRWLQTRETMDQQYLYELQQLLEMQPNAADAVRFSRFMSYTTLWPPLHNNREINITQNRYFRMKPKQRARLNYIMKYKIT